MNNIGAFRYWVQKVLPLVYDDSLSYYELLCKVVDKLNEVIDNENQLNEAFKTLKDFVDNYFDSTDFQEMVNNKLDEMAEDGTLEAMVNGKVYKDLQYLIPTDADKEIWKQSVLETLVTYLNIAVGSEIFEEGSPDIQGVPVCYKYQQGKGYYGLYGIGTFDLNGNQRIPDTESGTNYKVAYIDCTTFASLIFKGIKYLDSPYYKAFNSGYTAEQIYNSGLINVADTTKYWTIDTFNEPTSYKMALIMEQSGNHLKLLASNYSNEINVDDAVFDTMETGDIVFFGNSHSDYANRFKNIHHCAIYVESLDELNALVNGKVFKPIEDGDDKYGYLVHVVSDKHVNDEDWTNVLCIECLNNRIYRSIDQGKWYTIYTTKPFNNANNNSLSLAYTMGMTREGDITKWITPSKTTTGMEYNHQDGKLQAYSIASRGMSMGNVVIPGMEDDENAKYDLDNYKFNGHYRPYTAAQRDAIVGLPSAELSNPWFDLFCFDFPFNGSDVGTQVLLVKSTSYCRIYTRTCLSSGTGFSEWKMIGVPTDNGVTEQTSCAANSRTEINVTFNTAFPRTPIVNITPSFTFSYGVNNAPVMFSIANVTTTGFTIYAYNNTANAFNTKVYWRAELPVN